MDERYELYTECNKVAKSLSFDDILAIEKRLFSRTLINWRILDLEDLKKLLAEFQRVAQ